MSSVTFCGDSAAARQPMKDAPQPVPNDAANRGDSSHPSAELTSFLDADTLTEPAEVAESLDTALMDLKELGLRIPRHPTLGRVLLEVWLTSVSLRMKGSKGSKGRVPMAEMIDQSQIAISQKIDRSISMSFFTDPMLAAFLVATQVRRFLKHGFGEAASRSIGLFGVMQNSQYIRRYSFASVCARLATRVATDSRLKQRQTHVSTDWKGLLFPWTYPRRLTTKMIGQQLAAIKNSVDLSTTAFSLDCELLSDLFTWDTFAKVLECTDASLRWAHRGTGSLAVRNTLFLSKTIGQLAKSKLGVNDLSNDIRADELFLRACKADGDIISVSFHWTLIGAIAAIWGKYDEASSAYGHLKNNQKRSGLLVPISPQCRILMIYADIASLRFQGQWPYRKLLKLRAEIGFVYYLSKANPSGFAWAWNLICAEIARIFGRVETSFNYYGLARSKARDSGYLLPLAFVQECLGRFSLEQRDEVLAGQQLREACQFYSMWGCEAKVSHLVHEFSQLSSLRPERKVISTMPNSEPTQEIINKLDIRTVRSKSRLQSDSGHFSAIVDQIIKKSSGIKSAKSGITALLDEYIEEAKTKSRTDFDKEIAASYRTGVLNEGEKDIPGIDIDFFYQEAQHVGGDFFGYHYDSMAGHLYLQIGDVSAIGTSAILVSTAVSSALGTVYNSLLDSVDMSTDEVIYQLARAANAAIVRFGKPLNCSMTMAFVVLDIKSGQGSFLNAAHMPLYIKHDGKVRTLVQRGFHLGEVEFLEQCLVSRFQVDPGDTLFLYTDGLVKNRSLSGQSISPRNIRKIMGESSNSQSIYQDILTTYRDHIANNPVIDDCVFLAVGRHV